MLVPGEAAGGAPEGRPQIKLLDFGVAKIGQAAGGAEPGGGSDGLQTRAGVLMGTPAYMAPEQIRNSATVDPRADIYAIGVMLFEALTGERPFRGESMADLIGAHLFQAPPRPSEVSRRKGLPPRRVSWKKLDLAVLKALAKDPAARYPDCASLRRDLDEAWGRTGMFTDALESGSVPPAQARRLGLGLAAAAVLVGGLGLGAAAYLKLRRPAPDAAAGPAATAGTPSERARERLLTALRGDVGERRAALTGLDAVRSLALAPLVIRALGDDSPAVWRAAVPVAAALGRTGSTEASLLAALTARAGQAVGPLAVELAIGRRRLGATDATPVLNAAAANESMGPDLRLRAATVLSEAGELETPLLRQLLERLGRGAQPAPAVRQAAQVQLVRAGDSATERPLSAAARTAGSDTGREALLVLARAGRREAVDRLHELATSEAAPERRIDLLSALAAAGDERAVQPLQALLQSPQPRLRQRAVAALGTLGPAAAPAASALAPLLDDADRAVALTAAAALLAIAPAPPSPTRQVHGAG